VDVTLQFLDDCPNRATAEGRLRDALSRTGHADVVIRLQRVSTAEEAEHFRFVGSPTILVDGQDPFAVAGAPVGLACRLYPTPDGPAGSPTLDQLVAVLDRPGG
jgi:hypothetical protein